MNAPEFSPALLLAELNRRGVQLTATGDRLRYDAPAGTIGDLLPDLARFKPALLELLITPDDVARARVLPALAQRMDDDDILQLGRLLLKLDAGEEIE